MAEPQVQTPAPPVQGGSPETPTPEPTPTLREIEIGGQKFQVTPEVATAYEQRQRAYQEGIDAKARQIEELSLRAQRGDELQSRLAQAVAPQAPATPDLSTLVFQDPQKAFQLQEQRILQQIEARRSQERAMDQFWGTFYDMHKDLSPTEDGLFVQTVMARHSQELAPLSYVDGTAQRRLGELTKGYLVKLMQRGREQEPAGDGPNRAVVEGAGSRSPRPVAEPASPKSATQVLTERRAARREARQKLRTPG